jgi:hypothetical protein
MVPWTGKAELRQGLVTVQWSEKDSGGNFGLANVSRGTLSLGPKAFELLRTRNPAHNAGETLQMVISHEMGHLFGLMAHSRRCVDVLSYYHNGKGDKCFTRDGAPVAGGVEYRNSLPTAAIPTPQGERNAAASADGRFCSSWPAGRARASRISGASRRGTGRRQRKDRDARIGPV